MSYAHGSPRGLGGHGEDEHMEDGGQQENVFQMLIDGGVRPISPIPSMHGHHGDHSDMTLRRPRTPSPSPFVGNANAHMEEGGGYGVIRSQQQPRYNQEYYAPMERGHGHVEILDNTPKARFLREFDNLVFEGLESGSHTPPPENHAHSGLSIRAPSPHDHHHHSETNDQSHGQQHHNSNSQRYFQPDSFREHSNFGWAGPLLGTEIGDPEPTVLHTDVNPFMGSPRVRSDQYPAVDSMDTTSHWGGPHENTPMNGSHHEDPGDLMRGETLPKAEADPYDIGKPA